MATTAGYGTGLPVGTVTFLLTDIQASGRGWEADPEAMSKAVARHYEILDEAIARHGGSRPQEQGEGDSVVAAFTRAPAAVACALDVQRAMAAETWPGEAAVQVRIGLHTGDARLRDEDNYFGEAIVRCARLRALAHGGQVVLSRATQELVVDQLSDGMSLKDLGAHRLRDLNRPEQVFQLCHPDLESDFPPLRSLDALPNNLPLQLTSFIGRETEIETVKALMAESRLVTLTGSGGSGKTRLALHVAAEVLEEQPDGAWWVDLAPLADPELVPNAIAAALSIRETPGQSLTETLVRRLRDHRAIVLLDNCEHLIGACAAVADEILRGCPQLSLMATSREPLGVEGEISWRVPSLSLPTKSDQEAIESLSQCESVRLFIDRAVRTRPNFAVTNETAPAVAEICHRLDGIPLALELAAARVRLLTPEQIVEGLADRFRLLTGGRRTALPRQRTLEASVDWSYNLLSEEERAMLRRLSVFAGGFTLDAAEDVCMGHGVERIQVLDVLSSLVDRSLVQVEENGTAARYRLLETIRAYARQKLTDAGEAVDSRNQHLDHFLAFAERAAPELERGEQLVWLDRVDAEVDNLRAACDWGIESRRIDDILRLGVALTRYWGFRGQVTEAAQRFAEVLDTGEGSPSLRNRALAWWSWICVTQGDVFAAVDLAQRALSAQADGPDPETRALALLSKAIGVVVGLLGNEEQVLREAVAAAREADLPSVVARALGPLGFTEIRVGKPADGRARLDEAQQIARDSGDRLAELTVGYWACVGLAFQAEVGDRRGELDATLKLSREVHNKFWESLLLSFRSHLAVHRGEFEDAQRVADEARDLAVETSTQTAFVVSLAFGGFVEYAMGDLESGASHLDEAIEKARAMRFGLALPLGLGWRALVGIALKDRPAALKAAEEGVALARASEHQLALADSLRALAEVARQDGDLQRAEDLMHEALRAYLRLERKPGVVDSIEGLARLALSLESVQESARLSAAAESIRQEIGYVRFPVDRPAHDELVGRLVERLGEEAFDAAWAEGSALDWEAAVAYAERGRGERKRPSSGWASLTPAELDVVRLAAQGLTNPQIAEQLFVTRATVKSHLGHIFAKLGVATRAELAAEATRRGI